jgi:uncharacterized protein YqgC (DUF456 family)
MDATVWFITAVAFGVGLAGTVVPLLPGTSIIFLGALFHHFFLPHLSSWWTIAGLAVGVLLSVAVNWGSGLMGAKWFGASKWGVIGAAVGACVGIFFALPGLLLGPVIGALLGERLLAKRDLSQAVKSGAGAGVGLVLATVAQMVIALVMIALFLGDCWLW